MNHRDNHGQPFRFRGYVINPHDQGQQRQQREIHPGHEGIGHFDEFAQIVPRPVELPRPHALADYRRHAQAHRGPSEAVEIAQRVADGVGDNRRRAKGGNQAVQNQPPQLEHAVFHSAGNADIEDVPH